MYSHVAITIFIQQSLIATYLWDIIIYNKDDDNDISYDLPDVLCNGNVFTYSQLMVDRSHDVHVMFMIILPDSSQWFI